MSTTLNCLWGNPWHGKLGAGTIELVSGTAVSSITVDGVELSVASVSGNLGNTRYLKQPGLSAPTNPESVTDLHGEFKNDAVLFSDEYRYSPLSTKKAVYSSSYWLLFDGTLNRWRKMSIGWTYPTLSTDINNPSAANSPALNIWFDRGAEFGKFDRLDGDTTSDSTTFVSGHNLGLTYAYTPLTRPSSYPFNPTNRSASIAVRPDGRAIMIRLKATRWGPYEISDSPSIAGPFYVYDTSVTWIFNVWEVIFSDDGSSVSSITEVWPDVANVTTPVLWYELQATDISSEYWEYEYVSGGDPPYYRARYFVDVTFSERGNIDNGEYIGWGYETSIIVNADYDKDGNKRLHYFRMTSDPISSWDSVRKTYIGQYVSYSSFTPGDHIPSYTISTDLFHHEPYNPAANYFTVDYPSVTFESYSAGTKTTEGNDSCGIYEDGTAIKTWTTQPPDTLSFKFKTNNVTELYTGTTSHIRIGPGAIDDSTMTTSDYSSFNPRTGEVISSENPIGFV